tara:strand:+ start:505 stop:1578 length:1074 start_codon:yes stop_codon:yes gene_type:complete
MAYTTVNKSTDHFRTKLHAGTGSAQSITYNESTNMTPDFIWVKRRDATMAHRLIDSVRGNTKFLESNSSAAESTDAAVISGFATNGFSVGDDTSVNASGGKYISWNWKGGGASSSNSNGSITSTVSANTTSGFSIVKFTATGSAATIGHGLGVAPAMIWVKRTSSTADWQVYHKDLGATKYLELSQTQAVGTDSGRFNNTEPTSTVFSIGGEWNNGSELIAYCFGEVQGFSRIKSYVGNGNSNNDGKFVYTGFKPAWVMIKASGLDQNWFMYDNKRTPKGVPEIYDITGEGMNVLNNYIYADSTGAEATGNKIDFLSNGFKVRSTSAGLNQNAANYVILAFASQPLVGSNNIPATGF